ncbi:MAG TPA: cytochrome c peroxidase [Mariprofundaceae bacterium]|nr:cytochrome c peroxidase [Mariprofundaceae bacterium]
MNFIIKWIALPFIISSFPMAATATEAPDPISKDELKTWQLAEVSYPKSNPYQKATQELGKQLFFDPRLTGDRTLSCAACHFPGTGWSDPIPKSTSEGSGMARQAPSLINVAFQKNFFWDGRSNTLEDAIELHLKELSVMVGDIPALPKAYQQKFQTAFGSPSLNSKNIAKAIANFLRTIVVQDSAFDRWAAGNKTALSQSAKKGFVLFTGKAQCVNCHQGPNFSDSKFHNIGLNTLDPGRFDVSGNPKEKSHFRTSTLRQVSHTAPYMHLGNKPDLMSVIEFYNRGGDRRDGNNELNELHLTEKEEQELLDFLMTLTGSNVSVLIPQLPANDIPPSP